MFDDPRSSLLREAMPPGMMETLFRFVLALEDIPHRHGEAVTLHLGRYRVEFHDTMPEKCPTCGKDRK